MPGRLASGMESNGKLEIDQVLIQTKENHGDGYDVAGWDWIIATFFEPFFHLKNVWKFPTHVTEGHNSLSLFEC